MQKIKTIRFGEVEVDEDRLISFPKGLLGFPEHKSFALLIPNEESTFFWMQSITDPNLSFIVTDPALFIKDYAVPLKADQMKQLQLTNLDDAQSFVIVNKRGNVLTGNLQGPLVINTLSRIGEQLVIADKRYSTRTPLLELNSMAASA